MLQAIRRGHGHVPFVIFAVWAVFGFAYPATPLPIALNMLSKVLAFAAAVSLSLAGGTKRVVCPSACPGQPGKRSLTGKKWIAVVECTGFPIVVSVLFNKLAGLPVRD